jgi:excisionase family DNA binding protein
MQDERTPLFVRLPAEHAARLDRAAARVPAAKKDLIAGLVDRYVDPESAAGLAALRDLATPRRVAQPDLASPRRVVVDLGEKGPVVGHAAFRATEPPAVLDAEQAAELLSVPAADLIELAERGELPGRRIGAAWRFSRQALLDWLAGDPSR